jgi:hypothetical protein
MHAWGRIKRPYKELMAYMLASPMHFIICGRQKTVYGEDEETGELKAEGVTMRAEGETPFEPHILLRMESIRPKKTNEVAQIVAYAEKDRTGVLSGRSFVNPSFDSLCRPLLGLLGNVQGHVGSDQAAAIDAETLATQERDREAKSAESLRAMSAMIELAADPKALKELGKQITPEFKSAMLPSDVATLRERYQAREQALRAAA